MSIIYRNIQHNCSCKHLLSVYNRNATKHTIKQLYTSTTRYLSTKQQKQSKSTTIEHNETITSSTNTNITYKQHKLQLLNNYYNTIKAITCIDAVQYNNTYKPTHTIKQLKQTYNNIATSSRLTDEIVTITGRVTNKRTASKKLVFYDVVDSSYLQDTIENSQYNTNTDLQQSHKIQLLSTLTHYKPTDNNENNKQLYHNIHNTLHKGDIIYVHGFIGKSDKGELSIIPINIDLVTPCLHDIPEQLYDDSLRYKYRVLDYLVNNNNVNTIVIRSQVIHAIRQYMIKNQFIEVETPILWPTHGGAAAKPFITNCNALSNLHLYMRIAPELFLKQLIISGFNRVFEIGKIFRNEGIDHTHNPEFTSIEFYTIYNDYNDLMLFTENMLQYICRTVLNKTTIDIQQYNDHSKTITIDFSQSFQRIDILTTLRDALAKENKKLPDNVNDDTATEQLMQLCESIKHLPSSKPYNNGRLLDKLIEYYIEPLCIQPTFLVGHPICMSPLARSNNINTHITDRFELFINGSEYCNAYSELNNPAEQQQRMLQQAKQYNAGDNESQPIDELYINSLEYGLPPTAGFGMGIDRLVMLLTGQHSIRDVLPFPLIKSIGQQSTRVVDDNK